MGHMFDDLNRPNICTAHDNCPTPGDNMEKHTPTPWKIEEYEIDKLLVIGNNTTEIAYTRSFEDAAFIVRAVNCHEELLATAKHLLDLLADFSNGDLPPVDVKARWTDYAQAIAKAEGK